MQSRNRSSSSRGRSGSSRRGFAAMPREQVRRIASMGGRASHGGRGSDYEDEDDDDRSYRSRSSSRWEDDDYDDDNDNEESGYRMRGGSDEYFDEDEYDDDDDYNEDDDEGGRGSRRGFASMPREQVRRIASMGGRASHGGGRGRGSSSRSSSRGGRSSGRSQSSRY